MHRTEGLYNASNLFINGPPGTQVEQNWLNAVQEEIAYVIEQASITLLTADTDTRRQLKAALDALYTRLSSGTVMLFGQSVAPTGWTRKIDWQDNAMICYAATGSIGSGGGISPQSTHTHTGGSHALTEAELPSHRHTVYLSNEGSGGSGGGPSPPANGSDVTDSYTGYIGSGSSHSHGATGANTAPYYQEVIAATKD
jgi:hypothetical protein